MISAFINLIIWLLIIGLLIGLVRYVLTRYPLPAPFAGMVDVALVVIAVLIVVMLLLQLTGSISGGLPVLVK